MSMLGKPPVRLRNNAGCCTFATHTKILAFNSSSHCYMLFVYRYGLSGGFCQLGFSQYCVVFTEIYPDDPTPASKKVATQIINLPRILGSLPAPP